MLEAEPALCAWTWPCCLLSPLAATMLLERTFTRDELCALWLLRATSAAGCADAELLISCEGLRVSQAGRRVKKLRLTAMLPEASRPAAARPCGHSTFISAC